MIETSNLMRIEEKRKALMMDFQFITFDLLTYFLQTLLLCVKQYFAKSEFFLKYTYMNSLLTLLTY